MLLHSNLTVIFGRNNRIRNSFFSLFLYCFLTNSANTLSQPRFLIPLVCGDFELSFFFLFLCAYSCCCWPFGSNVGAPVLNTQHDHNLWTLITVIRNGDSARPAHGYCSASILPSACTIRLDRLIHLSLLSYKKGLQRFGRCK